MAEESIRRIEPFTGTRAERRPSSSRRTWPTTLTTPVGGAGAVTGICAPSVTETMPRSTSTAPVAVRSGVTTSYPLMSPELR